MRPLIITQAELEEIARVKAFAQSHRFTHEVCKALSEGKPGPIAGDIAELTIIIPEGYYVVYSLEEQEECLFHHLSISLPDPGEGHNPLAWKTIAEAFGINTIPLHIWFDGQSCAVNLLFACNTYAQN